MCSRSRRSSTQFYNSDWEEAYDAGGLNKAKMMPRILVDKRSHDEYMSCTTGNWMSRTLTNVSNYQIYQLPFIIDKIVRGDAVYFFRWRGDIYTRLLSNEQDRCCHIYIVTQGFFSSAVNSEAAQHTKKIGLDIFVVYLLLLFLLCVVEKVQRSHIFAVPKPTLYMFVEQAGNGKFLRWEL